MVASLDSLLDSVEARIYGSQQEAQQPEPDDFDSMLSKVEARLSAPKETPELGFLSEIGTALAGGAYDTAEMYARAGRVMGMDTTDAIENIKASKQGYEPTRKGPVWDAITGGIRSTVQSIGGGVPGAAVGALGGPAGAVGGFALGAGTLFSLAEYDQFLEEAEAQGIPREAVHDQAIISAIAEGGIEAATDILGAKIFGLAAKKAISEPIKQGLLRSLGKLGKKTAQLGAVEVPGEMATSAIQAGQRQEAGLPTPEPGEAALQAIGPSAVQTMIMGPLAGGAQAARRNVPREKPTPSSDIDWDAAIAKAREAYNNKQLNANQIEALKKQAPPVYALELDAIINDHIFDRLGSEEDTETVIREETPIELVNQWTRSMGEVEDVEGAKYVSARKRPVEQRVTESIEVPPTETEDMRTPMAQLTGALQGKKGRWIDERGGLIGETGPTREEPKVEPSVEVEPTETPQMGVEKEPWQLTRKQYLDQQITGFIPESAYKDYETVEGLNWIKKEKHPVLYDTKTIDGEKIEFRKTGEKLKYVKTDSNGDIVRDENGLATYLSDSEVKEKGYPLVSPDITAFVEDKAIGFASNEFGATGIWVTKPYQKKGIGRYLITEFRKEMPKKSRLGQSTSAGYNLAASYHMAMVQQALSDGKSIPKEVLKDYPGLTGEPAPAAPPPKPETKQVEQGKGEKKEVHDYSSTQVNLPKAEASGIRKFANSIPEDEIYTDPKDPSFGREENPHITVKYGLHTVNPKEVRPLLEGQGPIKAKLGTVSIFESDDYDVVKVDVESKELHALNKKISDNLEVTDTHPTYQPHVTIAYVKKGQGKKYVGGDQFKGQEITLSELTFSGKDGKETVIPLKLKAKAKAPDLLSAITSLQRPGQPRELVSTEKLRDKFPDLSKEEFDKAVFDLAKQDKVALHHHDFPSSLTPEKREKMPKDDRGKYVVGVVPVEKAESARKHELTPIQSHFENNVVPVLKDFFFAVDSMGRERLIRNRIMPDENATKWLNTVMHQQPTWHKGGRKTGNTGIQMLSQKNLWPTSDDSGENLRKSMLAALQTLRKAPGYSLEWVANVEKGAYAFQPKEAPREEAKAKTVTVLKPIPGNLLLRMKDGTVHESIRDEAPVHGVMLTNLNLNPDEVEATGLRDKNGEVVWSKPKEVKPFTTEEARAAVQQRKQETQKKIRKMAKDAPTFRMWLKPIGGINSNDPTLKGELRDIRWTVNSKGKKVPAKGFPPGFFNGKARSSDDIVRQAIEWGWLPEGSDENDLMKAIISNPSVTEKWTNAGNDIDKMANEEYEKIYGEEFGENWRDEKFRQAREEDSRRAKAVLQREVTPEVAAEEGVSDEEWDSLTQAADEIVELLPSIGEQQSLFGPKQKPAFELKPTEPTPEEKIAIARQRGEAAPTPDQAYQNALSSFREASAKFRDITSAYRNRTIGDDEFLAAKAEFNQAQKLLDVAEAALKGQRKRAVIPTEAIKAPTTGKQASLLPPKKGETIDLFAARPVEQKPEEVKAKAEPKKPLTRPLSFEDLNRHVDRIVKRWKAGPLVNAVEDYANIPEEIRDVAEERYAKQDLKGLKALFVKYSTGKPIVYLIGNRLSSTQDAETSILHEVFGHYGPRAALDDKKLDQFYKGVYFAKTKQVKAMVEEFPAYKWDPKKKTGYNLDTPEGRMKAADEWFAREVAEKGIEQDPWLKRQWDKFIQIVNDALRAMGFQVKLSDAEIRQVLRASVTAVTEGPTKGLTVSSVSANLEPVTKKGEGQIPTGKTPKAEGGNPFKYSVVQEPVYHGTNEPHELIKQKGFKGPLHYFTPNREMAEESYGPTIEAYLDIRNLAKIAVNDQAGPAWNDLIDGWNNRDPKHDFGLLKGFRKRIRLTYSYELEAQKGDIPDDFERYMLLYNTDVIDHLKSRGYDGVYADWFDASGFEETYGVFSRDQIKILPPLTGPREGGPDIAASIQSPEEWAKQFVSQFQKAPENKAEEKFDEEHKEDTLNILNKFKAVMKAETGGKWIKQKPDTKWYDRFFSVPSHHAKKVENFNLMYRDGLIRTDHYYANTEDMLGKTGGGYLTTVMTDLQKRDKEDYEKFKRYVVDNDVNAVGFEIKPVKDGEGYTVWRGKTKFGDTFEDQEKAWTFARGKESEIMKRQGYSDNVIDAVRAAREISDRGFRVLMTNLRKAIEYYEKRGLPIPEVTKRMEGSKIVIVDMKMALAEMGDLRGYFFPRNRASGRWMLIAKKEGTNKILEFRDYKRTTLESRGRELKKQGYTVTYDRSPKMAEDVFQMAGSAVGIGAIINDALKRINTDEVTLKDFNLDYTERVVQSGHRDFMVRGPTTKAMRDLFKEQFGGQFYPSDPGGVEVWHFANPGAHFEKRLSKALAANQKIFEQETELLFAKTVAEQIANIYKARGGRMHMIARKEAKGIDVWKGYEEDPATAYANYARGIAATEAKREMMINMIRHFTGTDVSFDEFKTAKPFEGSWEDYVNEHPDTELTEDLFDKINNPEEFKKKSKDKPWLYDSYQKLAEERRIDPVNQPNAFKEAKAMMEDMSRNEEFIDRVVGTVKGLAVLKYLTYRVAAPLVNLTALATSAPASISGFTKVPIHTAMSNMGKAGKIYTQYLLDKKGKGLISKEHKALFEEIEKKGWLKPQFNREALSVLESRVGRHWNNIIEKGMWMFGATEQVNRSLTIAGAYFAIKESTPANEFVHEKAIEKAKEISDMAHGVYSKANLPYLARGGDLGAQIFKSFYVFKNFSLNYLMTMKDLGLHEKEYKAALYMAISPMILAGSGALVGKQIITAIMESLGIGGDDPEETLYQWFYDNAGERGERLVRHGLFGVPGVNLKGSLEIGITDIPTSIADLLGAPGSLFEDLYYGGKSLARGDIMKGLEKMPFVPNALGSVSRAVRERTEGVTTETNAPVFYGTKPLVSDTVEAIYRGLSFNPSRIAGIREKQWKEREIEQKYSKMRNDISAKAKRFYLKPSASRNQAEWIDILNEMNEYNERVMKNKLNRKGIPIMTGKMLNNNIRRAFKPSKRERLREVEEETED